MLTYLFTAKNPMLTSDVSHAIKHTAPMKRHKAGRRSKKCSPTNTPTTVDVSTKPLMQRSATAKLNTSRLVDECNSLLHITALMIKMLPKNKENKAVKHIFSKLNLAF